MNKQKILGYLMAIVGFIMILINAIGYIFNINITSPVISTLGIIFVAIGMMNVRKYNK
jgi:hypothetical protein